MNVLLIVYTYSFTSSIMMSFMPEMHVSH